MPFHHDELFFRQPNHPYIRKTARTDEFRCGAMQDEMEVVLPQRFCAECGNQTPSQTTIGNLYIAERENITRGAVGGYRNCFLINYALKSQAKPARELSADHLRSLTAIQSAKTESSRSILTWRKLTWGEPEVCLGYWRTSDWPAQL